MATSRVINTNFWKDSYVVELNQSEKLLFLYFLTNPNTNIAGIYEISIRQMVFDTGLEPAAVQTILSRFMQDKKVYYKDGWLALNNWIKHQSLNPKVAAGIERIIDNLPEWLRNELLEPDQTELPLLELGITEPMDSVSKPIALNLTKLNLTKLNAPADAGAGFDKKSGKANGRTYAKAVEADKALAQKEQRARSRQGSGYASAKEVADKLKRKAGVK